MIVVLPVRTYSKLNAREHWRARARRTKAERDAAYLLTARIPTKLPVVVRFTRRSPGLLDDDNLRGALKSVRDGIADRLKIDDRDSRVTWEYAQQRAKKHEVVVEILPCE